MTREEHISNLESIGCDGWTVTTKAKESLEWAISKLKENKGEWIPIEERPLTDEEKEYYTDLEYPVEFMRIYDCPMPDDGQEVLITTSTGYVTTDTYYIDEGGYFENYCDEGDVKAWMPKPEPYKKGGAE